MPTIWINKLKTRFAKANKEIIRMEKKAHERIMSSTIQYHNKLNKNLHVEWNNSVKALGFEVIHGEGLYGEDKLLMEGTGWILSELI